VRTAATSDPASGSVIASAPISSPRSAGASQRAFCASGAEREQGRRRDVDVRADPGRHAARPAARELLGQHRVGDPVAPVLEPQPAALRQRAEHLVREPAGLLPLVRERAQALAHERARLGTKRLV